MNMARTELGVRPCVAWLEADASAMTPRVSRNLKRRGIGAGGMPNVEEVLIPRLDAKEVAAVFTAPFEGFLKMVEDGPSSSSLSSSGNGGPLYQNANASPSPNTSVDGEWYNGQWTSWHGHQWRMHNFYVPSSSQPVAWAEPPPTTMTMNRFRVFGMTARILVDAARVAFGREPAFEHNTHFGDEELIARLIREGKMGEKTRGPVVLADPNAPNGEARSGSPASSKM